MEPTRFRSRTPSRRARTLSRISIVLLIPAALLTPLAAAEPTEGNARISYISGSSIYIDAGREEGLREKDRVDVLRQGTVIATLEVTFLSPHRAACSVLKSSATLVVGDRVRFRPHGATRDERGPQPDDRPVQSAAMAGGGGARRGRLAALGIRGRVGVRYLVVKDRSGGDAGFSQPALDFRLDGVQVGDSPWGMAVDVRSRRTTQSFIDSTEETDGSTRVYRMALSWQDVDTPLRFTAGRQFSAALATVSIFDGVAADFVTPRWTAGFLSGTQPSDLDSGFSSDIREHGAYFQMRNRRGAERRWTMTTGVIGSYQDSEVNREFVYLQGTYTGPRLSIFATEEIDYNRGWKEEEGESSFSSTSTFLSARYRMSPAVDLRAGFDNRRNVRLFRDRITPVTEFDDAYRRGAWVGTSLRFARRCRVGVDYRSSSSDNAGGSDSYTLTLGADGLTGRGLGLSTRSTRYTNDSLEGWLHSITASYPIGSRLMLGVTGGMRDEATRQVGGLESRITWYGFDLDVAIGRQWYLLFSAERSRGDFEEFDQSYLSLSYRF